MIIVLIYGYHLVCIVISPGLLSSEKFRGRSLNLACARVSSLILIGLASHIRFASELAHFTIWMLAHQFFRFNA